MARGRAARETQLTTPKKGWHLLNPHPNLSRHLFLSQWNFSWHYHTRPWQDATGRRRRNRPTAAARPVTRPISRICSSTGNTSKTPVYYCRIPWKWRWSITPPKRRQNFALNGVWVSGGSGGESRDNRWGSRRGTLHWGGASDRGGQWGRRAANGGGMCAWNGAECRGWWGRRAGFCRWRCASGCDHAALIAEPGWSDREKINNYPKYVDLTSILNYYYTCLHTNYGVRCINGLKVPDILWQTTH